MSLGRNVVALSIVLGLYTLSGSDALGQSAQDVPSGGARTQQSAYVPSVPDRATLDMGFRSELVSFIRFRYGSAFRFLSGVAGARTTGGTAWLAPTRRRVGR